MMSNANGAMYGNIQGIKNLMKSYDKDGDYIDPTTGLAGLLVTEENEGSRKRIITIPESSKDEMFEQTKKEFLRENGVLNGEDVYKRQPLRSCCLLFGLKPMMKIPVMDCCVMY